MFLNTIVYKNEWRIVAKDFGDQNFHNCIVCVCGVADIKYFKIV